MQVRWDESIEAKAGEKGQFEVPADFDLALAPFLGEVQRPVRARLRYRISEGHLMVIYKLERPDDVKREALDAIAVKLGEDFPRTYIGQTA